MFRPFRWLKDVQKERRLLSDLDKAEKYFDMQRNAILGIKGTAWYEEIKKYWKRVREASVVRMANMDRDDVASYKQVQATVKMSQDFLDFLDNMENTPSVEP